MTLEMSTISASGKVETIPSCWDFIIIEEINREWWSSPVLYKNSIVMDTNPSITSLVLL